MREPGTPELWAKLRETSPDLPETPPTNWELGEQDGEPCIFVNTKQDPLP